MQINRGQKVYTYYVSLTSQKCWCLNKKSYKEEMLSSFSTFSYNLVMEILIHSSFINCICLDFLPFHYPKILTQNFLTTSKSTLFTLWNLKVLLCFYYLKLACKVWISKKGMLSLSHTFTLF